MLKIFNQIENLEIEWRLRIVNKMERGSMESFHSDKASQSHEFKYLHSKNFKAINSFFA